MTVHFTHSLHIISQVFFSELIFICRGTATGNFCSLRPQLGLLLQRLSFAQFLAERTFLPPVLLLFITPLKCSKASFDTDPRTAALGICRFFRTIDGEHWNHPAMAAAIHFGGQPSRCDL